MNKTIQISVCESFSNITTDSLRVLVAFIVEIIPNSDLQNHQVLDRNHNWCQLAHLKTNRHLLIKHGLQVSKDFY